MADDNTIGADAWTGQTVSAPQKKQPIPLSSDMPPLSGKSVTSVPEEHRFDRVPPPAKNINPKPEVPVDGYYDKYKEMMERRRAADGGLTLTEDNRPDTNKDLNDSKPAEPQAAAEQLPVANVVQPDREKVLSLVRSGTPAAIYDPTVIPLLEKGLVKLEIGRSNEGILEIVAVSTKDNQPLRSVGYARGANNS